MNKFYRVYWTSNDGDEMTKEIALVWAESIEDAIRKSNVWASDAPREIEGEYFEDAVYHAEAIDAPHQLEDVLNSLLWQLHYVTDEVTRKFLVEAAIEKFVTKP